MDRADFAPEISMPDNIDDRRIVPSIIDTQETYIRPLLCDDLYEEICEQIGSDTLSYANQALMCYVKEVHKRYAFADFLQRQQLVVTKESVVRKIANESEFVDMEAISSNVRMYQNYAKTFAAKLVKFLTDNSDDYPLWANCRCSCGQGTNCGCRNPHCDRYCSTMITDNNSLGFF